MTESLLHAPRSAPPRQIVGVGEFAVAHQPQTTLSSYALGACLGVVAYDPEARAGGLLHFMLPDSSLVRHKAIDHPGMFADTGIPALLAALRELGAHPSRTRVVLAGGADVLDSGENYRIGQRNIAAARLIVTRLGLPIIAEETGAPLNRTLHFCIGDARLMIKVPHHTIALDMHQAA